MPLTAGQTLSHYEILGPIGAGGMGEVYRAKDTRLDREVAIKVLPEELAGDEERLRRFEREAKTLASLNHPNVAGIHGVEQDGDVYFLALELVPGEDLGERLKRGPLPFEEAIDVCRQIAEGLEAAHEAGVVHRDLKPANVRLTPHGTAKLLDFGLAKPLRIEGARGATSAAESDSFFATEQGVVLGTPTYMSPEQARGKPVDRRTDIWALGCVLYECLTGRRAFGGESITDVLAAIVGEEPDWSKLPALPAPVAGLLRRMLVKDPRSRLRDAGEARVQLELACAAPMDAPGPNGAHPSSAGRGRWHIWSAGALALVVGMALGYLAAPPRVAVAEPQLGGRTLRFELDTIPASAVASDYALSPDGLHVAWTDIAGVHLRALDALEKQTLAAHSPGSGKSAMHALTWSPDGKTIAYSTADELWRVDIAGGTPVRVSEGESFWTGPNILAWSPDDRLVMATTEGLISVPAAGGTVAPFELPELEDTSHYDGLAWSSEGDLLLVRHREATVRPDTLSLYSDGKLVDLTTLVGWVISSIDFTSDAVWLVRESDGDKSIWRIPYSSQTKTLTGEPELVRSGATGVSVDGHGTAVHVLEQGRPETEMVWIDHEGQVEPFGRKFDGEFVSLSLSHDERQVLANNFVSGSSIWSYDLDRGITAPLHEFDQLTVTAGGTLPDGRLLGTSFDDFVTYAYPLDGRGEREPIVEGLLAKINDEGSFAVVFVGPRSGAPKLKTFELGTKNELLELRDSVSPQGAPPDISHDGRWLVFCTNRSGQANVALTRFPSGEGEWFVSVDGGSNAWFETDDSAIYFQRGGSRLGAPLEIWRVSFACEPAVRLGAPEQLFQIDDEFEVFEYHAPTRRFVGTRRRALAERRIVVETDVR